MLTNDLEAVVYPKALQPGDKIAILAPAGHVKRAYVDGAAQTLRELGYEPVIYPTVDLRNGQFSGTPAQRFADLKKALLDPEIRAVLCARGGYGLVHIMDSVASLPLRRDPKWVIGFSDISALHAIMASQGIASVHASMAQHISRGADLPENEALFSILKGEPQEYSFAPHPYNHKGKAEGKLLGGNLSVIQALIGTPYDVIKPGTILFIEDVDEPIYKIERIIWQLRMAGILERLQGLVIGQFTRYKPGDNHDTMEEMLRDALRDYPDLPVAFDVPVGHVRNNMPLIVSGKATLTVTPDSVTLRMR